MHPLKLVAKRKINFGTRIKHLITKPTTSSDNPESLVHFSNEPAEAIKAFFEESPSPNFTDITTFDILDTKQRG
jgi:hypothetical protein